MVPRAAGICDIVVPRLQIFVCCSILQYQIGLRSFRRGRSNFRIGHLNLKINLDHCIPRGKRHLPISITNSSNPSIWRVSRDPIPHGATQCDTPGYQSGTVRHIGSALDPRIWLWSSRNSSSELDLSRIRREAISSVFCRWRSSIDSFLTFFGRNTRPPPTKMHRN